VLVVPVFNKHAAITAVIIAVNKQPAPAHSHRGSGGLSAVGAAASSSAGHGGAAHFSEQDQSMVEFIALLAGSTIENALLFDEAVTRRNQTETLLQITELMASEVDTAKVMRRMIEASYLLISAERITLFMIDADKEELVAVSRGNAHAAHAGSGLAAHPGARLSMNRGILGFCATSGKPVNCMDARKDWRFDSEVDSSADCPTISLLVVPVTDHLSRPIAVIQAVNKRVSPFASAASAPITGGSAAFTVLLSSPSFEARRLSMGGAGGGSGVSASSVSHSSPSAASASAASQLYYFTKDEQALLQSMAVSTGTFLRKNKLYQEAIATRKKTEALLQISELMSADLQSDKIMAKIVQAAYMLVSCEYILLYMVDEDAGELVCEVGKDGSKGSRIPLGHGVAGHTALTGRSLNITDAQNDW